MTTAIGNEDAFDEVERGIDWLERLENIKARQDREALLREAVDYVDRLREAVTVLSGNAPVESVAKLHGQEVAELVASVKDDGENDPWLEYLRPALMDR